MCSKQFLQMLSLTLLVLPSAAAAGPETQTCSGAANHLLERAARSGDVDAQHYLGTKLFQEGCNAEERNRGLEMLHGLAEEGHGPTLFDLGKMLLQTAQTPQEEADATHIIRRSAEAGYAEAEALLGLLMISEATDAAEREKGVYWLGSAADKGLSDAAMALSTLYARGLNGVDMDRCAASLWEEAALLLADPDFESQDALLMCD